MPVDLLHSIAYRCPNQRACNHSVSELVKRNLYNPNVTLVASSWEEYGTLLCSNKSGYTGLLCASCKPGSGQTDAFTCSACLGVSANGQGEVNRRKVWGLLATYGAAFIVVIWSTIWWGVQESHTQEPEPDDRGRGVHGHGMHVVDVIKALAIYAQVSTRRCKAARSCYISSPTVAANSEACWF